MSYRENGCRIYVGNLPPDIRTREIEDVFDRYGRIRDINIKPPKGTGPNTSFAFVEFEDPRDADDAVHYEDGKRFDRMPLRVEIAGGRRRDDRGDDRGAGGRGPPGRSKYSVKIEGLTEKASWQDLKDHMRKACDKGDIGFADVYGDRSGVVDFSNADDMDRAIKDLDDSDFKDRFGETSRITVKENESNNSGGGGGGRSRSRSKSRSRSRSRSRDRKGSRSRSKSRSKSRSRDRDDHKKD